MAGPHSLAVALVGAAVAGLGAAAQPGQLVQLTGPGACVSQLDTDGICADARALNGPDALVLSPDGRFVYAASSGVAPNVAGNAGSVAVFARNTATGRITQPEGEAGCVGDLEEGCGAAMGIQGTSALAVSGNGLYLYATGFRPGSLASFSRSAQGALTQLGGPGGCIGADESEGCTAGAGLLGAADLAVAPGGTNVYVASFRSSAVAAFARDPANGQLRQLAGEAACTAEPDPEDETDVAGSCRAGRGLLGATALTASADGRNVYVLGRDSIAAFRREPGGGLTQLAGAQGCLSVDGRSGCAVVPQLENTLDLAISPDSRALYVASYLPGALTVLRRDPSTGSLAATTALTTPALDGISGLAITPDGRGLYAVSPYQDAVLAFSRRPKGRIERLPGAAGCVSDVERSDSCSHAEVLSRASAVAVSPDGRHVYVSSVEPIGIACACGRELGSLSVFTRSETSVSLARPRTAGAVRAGGAFRVTAAVRSSAARVTVSCSVFVDGRPIPAAGRYAAGTAVCTGIVRKGVVGSRLVGTVKVTAGGTVRAAGFSFPIRRAAMRSAR
ncbi:MAG TPA: beta-propeller fold lactonase family protein [Gaiellaceae bacterium]